ncbi:glycosyltransferase family 4 protein [Clostridium sp. CTA-7]
MKINVIIPFTAVTGGIKVMFQYINGLIEKGHEVNVYVPAISYKFNYKGLKGTVERGRASLFNCLSWRKVKWFDLKVRVRVVPSINNLFIEDADVTIATAWPTAYSVNNLNNKKGKKVYFIQHYETWSGKLDKVEGSYDLSLNQIVISKWLKDLMINKHKQSKVYLAYNGLENSFIFNEEKKFNEKINILIMHHNLEWKGFSDGLEALKIVKNKYNNINVKCFGLEDYQNDILEYHKRPKKEKLKELYRESDIYIFPSRFEGWGLTVIEAMANKCAVVGTKTGVLDDLGINEVNSLISDIRDIEGLANNIIRLIEDKKLLEKISNKGFEVAQSLELGNTIENYEKILKEIIETGE